MAFNRQQLRLRVIGHFGTSGGPLDFWSTGLRLAVVGGGPIVATDWTSFLEAIATPIQTFHASSAVKAGSSCFLTELSAAKLGLDGKYISQTEQTQHRTYTTPVPGALSSFAPWSQAYVISQRTAFARGYASNGRMYWPTTGLSVEGTTGRLNTTDAGNLLTAAKTMFDAINAAAQNAENGLRIHVMSSVGSGTSAMVTSIRGDLRMDSIERRENDQSATYVTRSLA